MRRSLIVNAVLSVLCAGFISVQMVAAQSVAVVSTGGHPALDRVKDGIEDVLAESGYSPEKGLEWQFQTADGSAAMAAEIARNYIDNQPDVIVAIATPAAQAVAAATQTIPVVYAAITDPVAAQLVPSLEPSGTNVTGVSDFLDPQNQIELIRKITPDAKRVGMVYNPGEANSVAVIKQLRERLPANGMALVEASAARPVDVGAAARSLVGKVDVLYSTTDNTVASAYEALAKVANDAQIPLVGSDTAAVERGATAAMGIDYYDLGKQAGRQVAQILGGEDPGDMPSRTSDQPRLYINLNAAKRQGIVLDGDLIQTATRVLGSE